MNSDDPSESHPDGDQSASELPASDQPASELPHVDQPVAEDSRGSEINTVNRNAGNETNPYASPIGTVPSEDLPVATLVRPPMVAPPEAKAHPRWWTPLAITAVSLFVFMTFSVFSLLAAMLLVNGEINFKLLLEPDGLPSLMESRIGFCCIVIPPQMMLFLPSVVAAFLSPVQTDRRLLMTRGHWPIWAWLGAAAAAPLVGLISSLFLSQFMTQSESLETMTNVFLQHSRSGFLIPLALIIGLTPAICEEILFRGYVQTRLNRSFGPVAGIFVASFLFAAFHMDWVHSIGVFPLGLFLGFVAWRSASIFPAMLAHFVNNVISVLGVAFGPETETDVLDLPTQIVTICILIAGIIGMAAVVSATVRYGKPTQPTV